MNIELAVHPRDLDSTHLQERVVVVFDVLRATTTIAAALCSGTTGIRTFGSLNKARAAHASFQGPKLLAGESRCLRPAGFDLGNSPCDFTTDRCLGRTIFLATTNGTRALAAASQSHALYAAALVNSSATADAIHSSARDLILLCAGTDGDASLEDLIGAGALLAALDRAGSGINFGSDTCQVAADSYAAAMQRGICETFKLTRGGKNLLSAELAQDLQFAADIDACPIVARCNEENHVVRAWC